MTGPGGPAGRTRGLRSSVVLGLALAAGLPGTPPASASCAATEEPLRLEEYDSVFAGTVTGTSDGNRVAEVDVDDVWHGPDLPPEVVVVGGQLDSEGEGLSSLDRTYLDGQRYAFFLQRTDGGALRDDECSATERLNEVTSADPPPSTTALDPPGVRAPDPQAASPLDPRGPQDGQSGVSVAAVTLGLVLAGGAMAVVLRRRRVRSAPTPV